MNGWQSRQSHSTNTLPLVLGDLCQALGGVNLNFTGTPPSREREDPSFKPLDYFYLFKKDASYFRNDSP